MKTCFSYVFVILIIFLFLSAPVSGQTTVTANITAEIVNPVQVKYSRPNLQNKAETNLFVSGNKESLKIGEFKILTPGNIIYDINVSKIGFYSSDGEGKIFSALLNQYSDKSNMETIIGIGITPIAPNILSSVHFNGTFVINFNFN